MNTKKDYRKKIQVIIFAPHLEYPTRNGSDIYADRLGCYLSKYRQTVQIVGAQSVTIYTKGVISKQQEFKNQPRSKIIAAIRTIFFQSHYLYEKFLTREFRMKSDEIYKMNPEALVIYSFLFSSALNFPSDNRIVLTHNDEIIYYQTRIDHTRNPLARLTASLSQKWILKLLKNLDSGTILAHITNDDLKGYEQIIPGHKNFIIPAGVEIDPLLEEYAWDDNIRLMFVGSLSVNMNIDALKFFAVKFYPELKAAFKDKLEVWIAGSNPAASVLEMCNTYGWKLYPNLPDNELKEKYHMVTFSILPFQYTTGAKIKLLNALSEGLPVLATQNMMLYPNQDFEPNLYSDEVADWIKHIRSIEGKGISNSQREACMLFTRQFSWDEIALETDKIIDEMLS